MATRSIIAYKESGVYRGVYCHNDGYPEHNGAMLKMYYNQARIVGQLIEMGDMSSLGSSIETSVFYSRNRSEPGTEAFEVDSLEGLVNVVTGSTADWVYVYDCDCGQWHAGCVIKTIEEDSRRQTNIEWFHVEELIANEFGECL